MARFQKARAKFRSYASRGRKSYGRARRRIRSGGNKILGILPQKLNVGGMRISMLLVLGVLSYFFVLPVKTFVNNIIHKR